ncbi:hypothetical protein I7I48_01159 [Histoplasma ohiense]|nr:hypothetical protein I7I48_01159 [Histoplasma ohiense (nom. inval.)]
MRLFSLISQPQMSRGTASACFIAAPGEPMPSKDGVLLNRLTSILHEVLWIAQEKIYVKFYRMSQSTTTIHLLSQNLAATIIYSVYPPPNPPHSRNL